MLLLATPAAWARRCCGAQQIRCFSQAKLWTRELQSSQHLPVPLVPVELRARWDICSLKDWETPAYQT